MVDKETRKRWHVLADIIKNYGYKSVVEVGVFRGETCGYLLESIKGHDFMIYAVDPYREYGGYAALDYEDIKSEAQLRAFVDPRCTHIEKFSVDAAEDFADRSVDMVFIDANHKYKWVTQDIATWWTKVRDGGVLSGHDYWSAKGGRNRGVRIAVNQFVSKNNLNLNRGDDGVWWVKK